MKLSYETGFPTLIRKQDLTMTQKKMTINDIARISGVSKTTVSRYLNGKFDRMSVETRYRIEEVIEATGYQPSNIAQSLKRNSSMLIGIIVADIESPFSSALIKSIGDSLQNTKYNLIIANSNNSYEKEQSNVKSLLAQQVDGMIVNTTSMTNPFLINLENQGTPIVLADRLIDNYKFNIAFIDNKEAVYSMINHLIEEGFNDLHFFTEPFEEVSPRFYRVKYFNKKMSEVSNSSIKGSVYTNDHTNHEGIINRIRKIIHESKVSNTKPAIICTNGVMLFHVAKAIEQLELKMPKDIGICGYDEWGWFSQVGWAEILSGGITTVSPSVHDLGNETINIFMDLIRDNNTHKEIIIPAPLKIRNSTLLSKK